jgi:hypothetical protein
MEGLDVDVGSPMKTDDGKKTEEVALGSISGVTCRHAAIHGIHLPHSLPFRVDFGM